MAAGKILFVKEGNIWLWQGGALARITHGARYRHPAWSPDGRFIAVAAVGDNHSDLLVLSAEGQPIRQLTRNASTVRVQDSVWAFRPAWSPDGRRIAFVSDAQSFDLALWMMEATGGGTRRLSFDPSGLGGADGLAWSPDGKKIAVASFRGGPSQIWSFDLATRRWQQLTQHPEGAYDPAWSPDGNAIAYAARQGARHNIWVARPDGADAVQVSPPGYSRSPAWSPDGRYLAYLSDQGQGFDLWVVPVAASQGGFSAGPARPLTQGQNIEAPAGLSWAAVAY